jgi:hypothetical protein
VDRRREPARSPDARSPGRRCVHGEQPSSPGAQDARHRIVRVRDRARRRDRSDRRSEPSLLPGVQWHPENFYRTGEFRDIFEGLVEAAKK